MKILRKDLSLPLIFVFIIFANFLVSPKPIIKLTKEESALNFKTDLLKIFSLGKTKMLTDWLWIQTLLESNLERSKNSWIYLRFETMTDLDPYFYDAYSFGGLYLSVITDDLIGASKIYAKGAYIFPDDSRLLNQAGMHSLTQLKDTNLAKNYFSKTINDNDTPIYIKSLYAKILIKEQAPLDDIYNYYLIQYRESQDQNIKSKLEETLYNLKAQIDLKCLNNKLKNCDQYDFEGNEYIFENKSYRANKKLKTQLHFKR